MSQKTRAGNALFFHHVQAGFIEQTIDSMFKISTLTSDPHLGALYSHRLTVPCWLLLWFTINMGLYYRWVMMIRFNVLLLNL